MRILRAALLVCLVPISAKPCAKTCTTRATLPGGETSWPVYFQRMAACPGYEQMVSTCEPLNGCESIDRRLLP